MPSPPEKGPDGGPPDKEPPPPHKQPDEEPSDRKIHGGISWREYDWLSPEQIGELLADFGKELATSGRLELDGSTVIPDSPSYFEGRKEQGPEDKERLIFEIEWRDRNLRESDPTQRELERRMSNRGAAEEEHEDLTARQLSGNGEAANRSTEDG